MNIIIGTWVEVFADSIVRKSLVPKCSDNPDHTSMFYFGQGNFCPTCGSKIAYIEKEEKGPAYNVRAIAPNYSGKLIILDSKAGFDKKQYTYILYDDSNDSTLYAKLLTESDCSGAYYLDDVLCDVEQIQETRDKFLCSHSSFLVSLDSLKIEYKLITGAGVFDW